MLTDKTRETFKQAFSEQYPSLVKKYRFSYPPGTVTFLFDKSEGKGSFAKDSSVQFTLGNYSLGSIQIKYLVVNKLLDILYANGSTATPRWLIDAIEMCIRYKEQASDDINKIGFGDHVPPKSDGYQYAGLRFFVWIG